MMNNDFTQRQDPSGSATPNGRLKIICFAAWIALGFGSVRTVEGQQIPWDLFLDSLSDSACDVVNAANAELVVLIATGELVIVTGADVVVAGSFVDPEGFVFLDDFPAGLLGFETDGDGFRTLWWLSFTGRVIEIDDLTLDISVSEFVPADFIDVPCDACPFWDDPTVCDVPEDPPLTIRICGIDAPISLAVTLLGLCGVRFARRPLLP